MRTSSGNRCGAGGFTLVELLVVITIIAILIALLLPSVQATREAARCVTCKNHLYQLSRAMLSHVAKFQRFPSGGWGWDWVGEPERGTDHKQPGGWVFNILDFLDQSSLRSAGLDLPTNERPTAIRERLMTPLSVFNCPSRRRAITYQNLQGATFHTNPPANLNTPTVARTDYACNAGDQVACEWMPGPGSVAEGDNPDWSRWHEASDHTGIAFERSEVKMAHIRDGANYTYMLGEKYLNPDHYRTGQDGSDNETMYSGYDNDHYRSTFGAPYRDRRGYSIECAFGSAHPTGWHATMCDGSVRKFSYTIDRETHHRLGNRQDRLTVDPTKF